MRQPPVAPLIFWIIASVVVGGFVAWEVWLLWRIVKAVAS